MAATKNPLVRLGHIRTEISQLTEAVGDADFETFACSYVLRRTTEHAVLIISEAVRALPDDLVARAPGPDWPAIRAIGNVLRHDYFAVEPLVLWRIVRDRLPDLADAVDKLIQDADPGLPP